jgi:hypothetical protein
VQVIVRVTARVVVLRYVQLGARQLIRENVQFEARGLR